MESDLKDICMNCGKEHDYKIWGATCLCGFSNVMHRQSCSGGCGAIMAQITDDDYCGPESLYCPECVKKAENI